jgi:hypothetical protein
VHVCAASLASDLVSAVVMLLQAEALSKHSNSISVDRYQIELQSSIVWSARYHGRSDATAASAL